MFGDRLIDLAEAEATGVPVQRMKEHVPITSQNSSIIAEYLKFLGTHVIPGEGHLFQFRFRDEQAMTMQVGGNCHRATFIIKDSGSVSAYRKASMSDQWLLATSIFKYHRVGVLLHGDYYVAACKFRDTTHLDTNHILRFYFLFATTLVHEVGDIC